MKTSIKILLLVVCFNVTTINVASASCKYDAIKIAFLQDTCIEEYIIDKPGMFELRKANGIDAVRPLKIRTTGKLKLPGNKRIREISARQEIRLSPGFSSTQGSSVRFFLAPSKCDKVISTQGANTIETLVDNAWEIGPSVYPNPNDGLFYFEVPAQKQSILGYNIWVFAADGRLIQKKEEFQASLLEINIQKNARGFYFIKAKNLSTGKDFIKKIIVN